MSINLGPSQALGLCRTLPLQQGQAGNSRPVANRQNGDPVDHLPRFAAAHRASASPPGWGVSKAGDHAWHSTRWAA